MNLRRNVATGIALHVFPLIASLVALFLSGCASVQPWEKELLSDPIMRFSTEHAGAVYEQHLLNSREGSAGGYGGSGGGCGCR